MINDETRELPAFQPVEQRRHRIWIYPVVAIIIGLSLWGYAMWDIFGDTGTVQQTQSQLEEQWEATPTPTVAPKKPPKPVVPLPGDAVARVSIPALGLKWVVVEGTSPNDIAYAPGHFSFSALPGQRGNFAVAGHRSPGLFWDLDKVTPGMRVVVESHHGTFTYVVTRNFITSPQSLPEVSPTPPGFNKGDKVLTLTTCNPKWDNYERLVIHASLVK